MKKILFLIHDLGQGGAEKVLVNLVNNMDKNEFDISVIALFGGGVNEQFLAPHIKFKSIFAKSFPGNTKLLKLFSPKRLHRMFIKDHYDIEVSYLEGPSARVISGCEDPKTKLVSWIHVEQHTISKVARAFKNETEAKECYNKFDRTICVSDYVKKDFTSIIKLDKPCEVLYNTVESDKIISLSKEPVENLDDDGKFKLVAVGTLKKSKGYDRLLHIVNRLAKNDKLPVHLYILGIGPIQSELENYANDNSLQESITFLGYDTNPYKYVANCDLFVCASHAEGFSTAATEALIVGTPVCTVEVSGMKEMLGENNEYGVVTENDENALYEGIKKFVTNSELLESYKFKAVERGKYFSTENTVNAVEEMLKALLNNK